jgi:hypothetical protein
MPHSTSDGNKIYSVDMMFAFINIFKPAPIKVRVANFIYLLKYAGWGDLKLKYSPIDVMADPASYMEDYNKIINADMSYPIIVAGGKIRDGMHRLAHAYLNKIDVIDAYDLTNVYAKFLINDNDDWQYVDNLSICNYIELFYERFSTQLNK